MKRIILKSATVLYVIFFKYDYSCSFFIITLNKLCILNTQDLLYNISLFNKPGILKIYLCIQQSTFWKNTSKFYTRLGTRLIKMEQNI